MNKESIWDTTQGQAGVKRNQKGSFFGSLFHLGDENCATILVADGKLDPLIGIYNSDLSAEIYEIIKDKPQKIIELFKTVKCGHYEFKGDMKHLDNINTPEDYEALR